MKNIETLKEESRKWFWSLSINEQNKLIDNYFPNRQWREIVIQNPSNILEMYEKEIINK
jgi:hypothetical protein